MKKSRFNPSQIASILKEFDGGKSADEITHDGGKSADEITHDKRVCINCWFTEYFCIIIYL
ncbi:MAG: hypothetical protein NT153_13180 [Bacteroidetes bacterium]|nr:hypothetical protein [Bacteroidota bacterium]